MSDVILAGPDPRGLADRFAAAGATVARIPGAITASALAQAGIEAATVFVLTDPTEATGIPLAREHATDLRVVVYADGGVPEFASHQADLVLRPSVVEQELLVEELLREENDRGD